VSPTYLPTGFIAGHVGVVWLGGDDRLNFLERMSSNGLADLAPGRGRATVVLTDSGRVVDVVACHASADGAALVTTGPGAAAVVTAHLKRYILFQDDVRVTDASDQVTALRVVGPGAAGVAEAASGIPVEEGAPGTWIERGEGTRTIWLLAHPDPGGHAGFDIVVPAGTAAHDMAGRLAGAGAAPWDAAAYAVARVRAGLTAFGHEFGGAADTGANPLELNLRPLVDFTKGCYIGQEVVARLENFARVQRRLVRLLSESPFAHGDRVEEIEPAVGRRRTRPGRVTTAVPNPDGGWLALALLPLALADSTRLQVVTAAGAVEVRVEPAGRAGTGA